jgi:hypothetical protein
MMTSGTLFDGTKYLSRWNVFNKTTKPSYVVGKRVTLLQNGQLFICRCVELFQLRLCQAGFEVRIGGIAWLHSGGSWLSTLL